MYTSTGAANQCDDLWNPDPDDHYVKSEIFTMVRFRGGWYLPTVSRGGWYMPGKKWSYGYRESQNQNKQFESVELQFHPAETFYHEIERSKFSQDEIGSRRIIDGSDLGSQHRGNSDNRGKKRVGRSPFARGITFVKRWRAKRRLFRLVEKTLIKIHPFWKSHASLEKNSGPNYIYVNIVPSDDTGKFISEQFNKKIREPEFQKILVDLVQVM